MLRLGEFASSLQAIKKVYKSSFPQRNNVDSAIVKNLKFGKQWFLDVLMIKNKGTFVRQIFFVHFVLTMNLQILIAFYLDFSVVKILTFLVFLTLILVLELCYLDPIFLSHSLGVFYNYKSANELFYKYSFWSAIKGVKLHEDYKRKNGKEDDDLMVLCEKLGDFYHDIECPEKALQYYKQQVDQMTIYHGNMC